MKKNNPLVSIIVPVYKVENYLRTCIESVLKQTYRNWEMILVDDGSPDKCGEICDEYAKRDRRITVLHKENGGLSSARNAALDLPPRGEFVTFLDSDDFWHPDYLKTLIELAIAYNADIIQCGFVKGDSKDFPILQVTSCVHFYDNHSVFISEAANIVMWGKLFRYNLFEGIRMPIGLYNEDDWTTWKLYYKAKSIVVTNQQLYYYTINPNSTMAMLGKKPDLQFINAYNERIGFFLQTGEQDLEHCSRLQLCKSLVLNYRNTKLADGERRLVKNKFEENRAVLKSSPYIGRKYEVLFCLFHFMPLTISKIAVKLHTKK